ncbi:hypothetical protein QQ008_07365 [Fulvivirgaceae bacterium BMA10]|uniref:Tetratricopeptide repeat protein n=1 Tax=Splendidivirga corallicola TaxID=3051826 RepID=A0ABT8KLR3_9BACT|nr:hypothetical protein [Fulvivirgaceae bacterium BMA10]
MRIKFKLICAIILLNWSLSFSNSTHNERDSLLNIINQTSDHADLASVYYHLSYISLKDSLDKAILYCKSSEEHALKARNKKLLAKSYFMMGYLYHLKADLKLAVRYYMGARKAYRSINNLKKEQEVLRKVALIAREKGRYNTSLEFMNQRLKIAEKIDNWQILQDCYFELGLTHKFRNDIPEAFRSIFMVKRLIENNGNLTDTVRYAEVFNEIGILYYRMMLNNSISYKDSAFKYYNVSRKLNGNPVHQSKILNNLARLHLSLEDYAKAKLYLFNALNITAQIGSDRLYLTQLNNLGVLYYNIGDIDSSYYYLDRSIKKNLGTGKAIDNIRDYDLRIAFQSNRELITSCKYMDSLSHKMEVSFDVGKVMSRINDLEKSKIILDQGESEMIMEEVFLAEKEADEYKIDFLWSYLTWFTPIGGIATLCCIVLIILNWRRKKRRISVKKKFKAKYDMNTD